MPYDKIYTSRDTLKSMKEDTEASIKKWAKIRNIHSNLIRAIIEKESEYKSRALRIDYKVLKKAKWYLATLSAAEKKEKKYYASYGVMQVLYGNAKHSGYRGLPAGLYDSDKSIEYGSIVLRNNLVRYKEDVPMALAGYNGGHAAVLYKKKWGFYPLKIRIYIKKVYGRYMELGK